MWFFLHCTNIDILPVERLSSALGCVVLEVFKIFVNIINMHHPSYRNTAIFIGSYSKLKLIIMDYFYQPLGMHFRGKILSSFCSILIKFFDLIKKRFTLVEQFQYLE